MPKSKSGVESNGARKRKASGIASRQAVARARGGRGGARIWILAAGVLALIAVPIITRSIRSKHDQAVPPELSNPPATTAVEPRQHGRDAAELGDGLTACPAPGHVRLEFAPIGGGQ